MHTITINSLDRSHRATLVQMVTCDQQAGELVREFISARSQRCGTDAATLELIAWLCIARRGLGVQEVGHA